MQTRSTMASVACDTFKSVSLLKIELLLEKDKKCSHLIHNIFFNARRYDYK